MTRYCRLSTRDSARTTNHQPLTQCGIGSSPNEIPSARAVRTTYEAMPEPRLVVGIGDCARNCGAFAGAHVVVGPVDDVVPVDLHVPGCPPPPDAIVAALRSLTGR